jgi:hypothetical protein
VITAKRMRWVGHVAFVGNKYIQNFLLYTLVGRALLGDLDVDSKALFEWMLEN